MSQIAGTVTAIRITITIRPPYLSVQMPSGTRISDPVNTGIAVSRPNSVALRFSAFLIGIPITPNIIHTMKHTVKPSVLTISTDQALRMLCAFSFIRTPQTTGVTVGDRGRDEHSPVERRNRRRTDDAATAAHPPEELFRPTLDHRQARVSVETAAGVHGGSMATDPWPGSASRPVAAAVRDSTAHNARAWIPSTRSLSAPAWSVWRSAANSRCAGARCWW